jgi:hypothetical protein
MGIVNMARAAYIQYEQQQKHPQLKGLAGITISKNGSPAVFYQIACKINTILEQNETLTRGKTCLQFELAHQNRTSTFRCPDSSWILLIRISYRPNSASSASPVQTILTVRISVATQAGTAAHARIQNNRIAVDELPSSFSLFSERTIPSVALQQWLADQAH